MATSSNVTYGNIDDCKRYYGNDYNRCNFLEYLRKFLLSRNETVLIPKINGRYVDIYDLYGQVTRRGGFDVVCRDKLWTQIASSMNIVNADDILLKAYGNVLRSLEIDSKNNSSNNNSMLSANSSSSSGMPMNSRPIVPNINQYSSNNSSMVGKPISMTSARPISIPNSSTSMGQHMSTIYNSNSNVNKRPKIESTESIDRSPLPAQINSAIAALESADPHLVIKGLNFFTQKSYELQDSNAIQLELYPQILSSLSNLLDLINPLPKVLFNNDYITNENLEFWVALDNKTPASANIAFQVSFCEV